MRQALASTGVQAARDAGCWLRATLGDHAQLTLDSRSVCPGDGFIACKGRSVDGRQFITDALARGAGAILVQQDGHATGNGLPVPGRFLPGLDLLAGDVAAAFYDDPSTGMQVAAVTGTNGKTSCANWIAAGLPRSASIGTLGVRRTSGSMEAVQAWGEVMAPALTTPDAVLMHRILALLRTQGISNLALEASSIGLDQHRLAGVAIDVAVFTNLTRDHLDYHGSWQAYRGAKRRLFERAGLRAAIVNGDDPAAADMLAGAREANRKVRCIAFGFEPHRHAPQACELLRITRFEATAAGSEIELEGDLGAARVSLKLMGRFNASNAAAVCAAWTAMGLGFDAAAARLAGLEPVSGRLQAVGDAGPAGPLTLVDYAHTPQALEAALAALRESAVRRGGLLWCVFGCGGDRDAGKRPEMAALAEAGADRLVLTSDNPRSEPAQRILDQMQAGLTRSPFLVEADRARAIEQAILSAQSADVVLIAGKGHETTQEIAGRKVPFSDVQVASRALQDRAGAAHA